MTALERTPPPRTNDKMIEQQARELLAAELGCLVESDTELDLRDQDHVWRDAALRAIVKALSRTPPPRADDKLIERLRAALDPPEAAIGWFSRDYLGEIVREAWVKWAEKQPNPKPSWLVPYRDLSEADKEADRQIGVRLARVGASTFATIHRFLFAEIIEALSRIQPMDGGGASDQAASLSTPNPLPPRSHPMTDKDLIERLREKAFEEARAGATGGEPNWVVQPEDTTCWKAANRLEGLSRTPPPRVDGEVVEALEANARALNALIECVGGKVKAGTHYRWHKMPTFAEVQAALEANNKAREALSRTPPACPDRDVVEAGKLTPEYLAMTPLQKWETLALNGLLGTDEPWIEDMRAALSALPPRQGWMPIETALRNGEWLLLWNDDAMFTGYWIAGGWNFVEPVEQGLPPHLRQPTHWMPLPAPPRQDEGEV